MAGIPGGAFASHRAVPGKGSSFIQEWVFDYADFKQGGMAALDTFEKQLIFWRDNQLAEAARSIPVSITLIVLEEFAGGDPTEVNFTISPKLWDGSNAGAVTYDLLADPVGTVVRNQSLYAEAGFVLKDLKATVQIVGATFGDLTAGRVLCIVHGFTNNTFPRKF